MKLEESIEKTRTNSRKIFDTARDRINQAGLAFKNEDYTATINHVNSALELTLKEELGIPTTIREINTGRIIEFCTSERIGPIDYFAEAKKHITSVDNKTKHQGYVPSKAECINALKIIEELILRLESNPIKLTEEMRNRIYGVV